MTETTTQPTTARARKSPPVKVHDVLIVGAGFAGLGTAIRLRQQGVNDVVILERGTEVGGTWRDNQYPGAACDIPSNLYSYSFAPNPNWSRGYSGSAEILAYTHDLVTRFGLAECILFKHTVTGLAFDESRGQWRVSVQGKPELLTRCVVLAQGPLSNASFPKIAGLDTYAGHKMLSSRWDHDYDMAGKRVAVIGTGASAIQIVPELVKAAASVKVFQRTAPWVLPRPDYATTEAMRSSFKRVPAVQSALRKAMYVAHESMATGLIWNTPATRLIEAVGRWHLRHQVEERWLRRQLTPDTRIGCKRVLVSNDWYPALQAPNCKLITWPIANLSPQGIRTVEGVEHQFDCIVFATGFDVTKAGSPFPVSGIDGRVLDAEWSRGAQAYKSVNVSGYPNLFMTFGPNSGPGHNSALVYMESQIEYLLRGIKLILDGNLKQLDVRADAQAAYNREIQKRLARTNWNSGCKSWYLTEDGFNATMFPGFATQYAQQMRTFRTADYAFRS